MKYAAACFSISCVFLLTDNALAQSSDQQCISSDGVPNHAMGQFPTTGNPHQFKKQNIEYCFSSNPVKSNSHSNKASVVGVTLTGIPIRPSTADWYDGSSPKKHSKDNSSGLNLEAIKPNEKIFGIDQFNGHVDHRGLYHYHNSNSALVINGNPTIGYAADGFEILYIQGKFKPSWKLKDGTRPIEPYGRYDGSFKQDYEFVQGHGDLDECNGMIYNGTYRYFATDDFPFFPRCHWGQVSEDFVEKNSLRRANPVEKTKDLKEKVSLMPDISVIIAQAVRRKYNRYTFQD